MKESEFETEKSHFRTFMEFSDSCDHDYEFIATLSTIQNRMGEFVTNELYQCCKCMKIGVSVNTRKIGTN